MSDSSDSRSHGATIPLSHALSSGAGLFHATCVLSSVNGCLLHLADGSTTDEILIAPEKAESAIHLVGRTVVATVLRKSSGDLRALVVRSPSDFERWWETRSEGKTVAQMYEKHRAMIERLRVADWDLP